MKTDRKQWLAKAEKLLGGYKVVIIEGLRRIGKSVLMNNCKDFNIVKDYEHRYFQVDMFGQDEIEEAKKLLNEVTENQDKNYFLMVDEFQDLEDWNLFFKSLHQLNNVKVVATGSISANKDMVNNTEGGRFAYIHMLPLSYAEYKLVYSKTSVPRSPDDLFDLYATMGSYPGQEFNVDINNLELYKQQVSANIVEKIKNVSMLKRAGLDNDRNVVSILFYIVENNGGTMSINSISKKLNIHLETVKKVISYLKQSFIIYEVANSVQGRGRAATTNTKYYLNDHTFYLFAESVVYSKLSLQKKNTLFENIIFNNIRGTLEKHVATLHFEIDKSTKADIDLVVLLGNQKHYFEIKNTTSTSALSDNQKVFATNNKLSVVYLGQTKMVGNIQYINYIEFMEGCEKWIMNN